MRTTSGPVQPKPVKAVRGRRPLSETPGREALLGEALVQFSKYGYEATSLRDLAQAARVDVALVARLFGSKANLWESVVEQLALGQQAHLGALEAAQQRMASRPADAMRQLVRVFVQLSYDMPALGNFLMHEMSNPGPRMNMLMDRLVMPFRQACWPIMSAAMEAGVIRSTRPDLLFAMLISAIAMTLAAPDMIHPGQGLTPALRDDIEREVILLIFRAPDTNTLA